MFRGEFIIDLIAGSAGPAAPPTLLVHPALSRYWGAVARNSLPPPFQSAKRKEERVEITTFPGYLIYAFSPKLESRYAVHLRRSSAPLVPTRLTRVATGLIPTPFGSSSMEMCGV